MATKNIEPLVIGHKWHGTTVEIQARQKTAGRTRHSIKTLDFKKLGLDESGIAAQCITDSPAPLQSSDAWMIVQTLRAMTCHDAEFRHLLSSEPAALTTSDISSILLRIDAYFGAKRIKSKAATAERFRSFILGCQAPLSCGSLAKQTAYKSPLKVPPREPRKDIAPILPIDTKVKPIKPIEAIRATSTTDFKEIAKRHYAITIEPILQKCIDILDMHAELQKFLTDAQKEPLVESLTPKALAYFNTKRSEIDYRVVDTQSQQEQLIIALAVIKRDKLQKYCPRKTVYPPQRIELLNKLSATHSTRGRFGALLSLNYLSRHVVMACYIILLIHTRWNADTLISVTPSQVRRTAHGYEISGVKSKTNTNQSTEVLADDEATTIEDTAAVRALELLLWHNENIRTNARRLNSSLFVSMTLSYHAEITFDVFLDSRYFHEFTSVWQLQRFTGVDIRANAERYHFLKSNMNIEASRVTLGHKQASTSRLYVAGELYEMINEAIIIRYQAMLASAIEFTVNGTPIPDLFEVNQKQTIKNLLLPPTRFSSNVDDYLVDMWLANPNEFKFSIGDAEVMQCFHQKRYYLKNLQSLRRANPERFCKSEIPRILVCLALYKLIKGSPFHRQLALLEETYNG